MYRKFFEHLSIATPVLFLGNIHKYNSINSAYYKLLIEFYSLQMGFFGVLYFLSCEKYNLV